MKSFLILAALTLASTSHARAATAATRQTQSTSATAAQPGGKAKHAAKVDAAVLINYAGRYELGAGIIPVTTLDVTLENNELWVKPTLLKKRRLIATRSRRSFLDEIEGTRYIFNRDDEGRIVSLTFRYEGSDYTAQRVTLPPP
ncbi:MAG TPA: hypothetical protein VF527_09875, partial [Pyrinomonadaceae bacterium]